MKSISFTTLHGKQKLIEARRIVIRPAAYGICLRRGHVLLVRVKSTGRWFFPGGGMGRAELLPDGLRREVLEETGLEVSIGDQVKVLEHCFYYDPLKAAYHMYMIFFRCRAVGGRLRDEESSLEETHKPSWVRIDKLRGSDFDAVLAPIVCYVQSRHGRSKRRPSSVRA